MTEDAYGCKADPDRHESCSKASQGDTKSESLPNPWLDNPRPVSKEYPGIQLRLKEFHNRSRIMHRKGERWPYRLHPVDETVILFTEFRGYGVPPNDIGHPGDLYIDLTPSPGPKYLLYTHGLDHWNCINWSKDPYRITFQVPKHPLLKDRLLSGSRTTGFSWVTLETINRRHRYSQWIDMAVMIWEAIEFDKSDALHVELTEDALKRKDAEEQRRKVEWDVWLVSNPSTTTTEQPARALARKSIQQLIRERQEEGLYKQTDKAMLHGPLMYPTPLASTAQPSSTLQLDAGFGSSSTQKRKRSPTSSCDSSLSSLPPNKRLRCSKSTSSDSDSCNDGPMISSVSGEAARNAMEVIAQYVTQHAVEKDNLKAQVEELSFANQEEQANATHLRTKIKEQDEKLSELAQIVAHIKRQLEEKDEKLSEAAQTVARVKIQLEEKDDKLSEATQTVDQVKKQLDENMKALQHMTAERDKALSEKLKGEAIYVANISQAKEIFLKGQQFLVSLKSGTS